LFRFFLVSAAVSMDAPRPERGFRPTRRIAIIRQPQGLDFFEQSAARRRPGETL